MGIKSNQTALHLGLVRQIIYGPGLTQFAIVRRKACNFFFKLFCGLVSCDSIFYGKTNIYTHHRCYFIWSIFFVICISFLSCLDGAGNDISPRSLQMIVGGRAVPILPLTGTPSPKPPRKFFPQLLQLQPDNRLILYIFFFQGTFFFFCPTFAEVVRLSSNIWDN